MELLIGYLKAFPSAMEGGQMGKSAYVMEGRGRSKRKMCVQLEDGVIFSSFWCARTN